MIPRAGGRKESDAAASDQDFARWAHCGEGCDLEYRIHDNGLLFHFSRCVEFEHMERQRETQPGIVFENGLDSGHLVVVSVDFFAKAFTPLLQIPRPRDASRVVGAILVLLVE